MGQENGDDVPVEEKLVDHFPVLLFPGLFLSVVGGLILWAYFSTSYEITPPNLLVRFGPLRWTIPLEGITQVERKKGMSPDWAWGAAWSLDRVVIKYRKRNGRTAPSAWRFRQRTRTGSSVSLPKRCWGCNAPAAQKGRPSSIETTRSDAGGLPQRQEDETNPAAKQAPAVPSRKWPGRAFEPCGLPDLPGRNFIWPSRTRDGPTRDDDLDFAPWHAPQEKRLRIPARQGTRRTETVVVVTVRRHIVVTVGRADVRRLIVERAATQHTATRSSPSGS